LKLLGTMFMLQDYFAGHPEAYNFLLHNKVQIVTTGCMFVACV